MMDSPPSVSVNSDAPVASEDSGVVINRGSFSSDSAESRRLARQASDLDGKSLKIDSGEESDSSDTSSELIFDTLRKKETETDKEFLESRVFSAIDPPNDIQDNFRRIRVSCVPFNHPRNLEELIDASLKDGPVDVPMSKRYAAPIFKPVARHNPNCTDPEHLVPKKKTLRSYTPPILGLIDRAASPDNSLRPTCIPRINSSTPVPPSRMSTSHNSLNTESINQLDDSNLISEAVSLDNLVVNNVPEDYTPPFTSDVYSVPVDSLPLDVLNMERPKTKKIVQKPKRRSQDKYAPRAKSFKNYNDGSSTNMRSQPSTSKNYDENANAHRSRNIKKDLTLPQAIDSHSTAHKQRSFMRENRNKARDNVEIEHIRSAKINNREMAISSISTISNGKVDMNESPEVEIKKKPGKTVATVKSMSCSIKKTFCNIFRRKKTENRLTDFVLPPPIASRALPPLPITLPPQREKVTPADFASSIEKVKDCGWYWGPISVETAEKVLCNEPDGSFIVRDSSDDHYIFTLTFKLHGMRHVRIEHDHGNFCFGGCSMFRSQTIVEFIENAVETSRSGRYLFFLNLRPMLGPVRVQLLHPVSRFTYVQSLQHMCRYVILKNVRRDLVSELPLPRRLVDYLNAPQHLMEF